MLRNGELEFAFLCTTEQPNAEFSCIQGRSDRIAAVLPADHPLAKKRSIQVGDLESETLVLLSNDSPEYTLCTNACREAGFEPHIGITCRFESSILDIVSTGFGVGLMYQSHALEGAGPSLAVVDIEPPIFTSIYVLYKEASLSKAGMAYLQHLKAQQIIPI